MQNVTNIQKLDSARHLHPMTDPLLAKEQGASIITWGEGIHIYTEDGKEIIDAVSGLGCVSLGYGNKRICDAAQAAMQQLSYAHSFANQSNPWAAKLSAKLSELTDRRFDRFFFASTGSDAVESAIKIAWAYWRRKGQPSKRVIVSRDYAYHGNTIFATSLTGPAYYHEQFGLPLEGMVHHIDSPYWYKYARPRNISPADYAVEAAAKLQEAIDKIGADNIAAFIGEPVQGAGGAIMPPEGYWSEIQRICRENDILLIDDEVVTGFGKTGEMFAYEKYGFEPDLIVMAKGISSAYFPISSVGLNTPIITELEALGQEFMHGFTNCGHPVGAAVALECVAILEEERLVEHVRDTIEPMLAERMPEFLKYPFVGEVRVGGVSGVIEIDPLKVGMEDEMVKYSIMATIEAQALEHGLNIRGAGSSVYMSLPLITTKDEISEILHRLHLAMKRTTAQLAT